MNKAFVRALLCVVLVSVVILAGSPGAASIPAPFLEASSVSLRLIAPYGQLFSGNADDDCPDGTSGEWCGHTGPIPGDPPPPPPTYPPSISGSVACTNPGSNGWCRAGAVINLSASDPQGYATTIYGDIAGSAFSCPGASCSRPLPEGSGTISYSVVAASGLSAAGSTTWAFDPTPPDLSVSGPLPDGLNGWYVGSPAWTLTANDATSGLASAAFSDGSSSITITQDGVWNISAIAVDNAGNTTSWSVTVKRDATPPKSSFLQPLEGSKVKAAGEMQFTGASADTLSGLASAEISLDGGETWQALPQTGGAWSYAWDTTRVPDGLYTVLVRADDKAGNRESTAMVRIIVGNRPPKVDIQESWWLWETGSIRVQERQIDLRDVTLRISCAPYHPDVLLTYTRGNVPTELRWDRQCGNGAYAAESGNYPVTVTACDIFGHCAEAEGMIKIPVIAPPIPTRTPTAMPTETVTAAPKATKPVQKPQPTPTQVVPPPVITPVSTPANPAPKQVPAWFWSGFALVGSLMTLTAASIGDPRPRALRRLGRTMSKVRDGQK